MLVVLNGHFAQINLCNTVVGQQRLRLTSFRRCCRCPSPARCRWPPAPDARSAQSAAARRRVGAGGDNAENVLDHQRRQAHRRLIEDQQARLAEQGAVERQQLLFATGEQPGQLVLAFGERGKLAKMARPSPVGPPSLSRRSPGAHLQVFQHRHAGKDAASFRHHHQSFAQQDLARRRTS